MRLRHLLLAAALLVPVVAHADEFDGKPELSTGDKAKIEAEQDEAHKAIDEKYKDDDSDGARAAKQAEYREADQKVLDKHGLSEKDFMWQNAHNSPDDRRAIAKEKAQIEAKEKAEKDAASKKKDEGNGAPQVIRGFDENHPLDVVGGEKPQKPQLDANGNPLPTVEKLNPADDPNAAAAGAQPEGPPPGAHYGRPGQGKGKSGERKKHRAESTEE